MSPTPAPLPLRLGRYEVLRQLGKGSMGVVYLARDPLIGRQVAIKTFRLGHAADEAEEEHYRSRFIREAQSAGILSQHPGIVTIHDVVDEPDGTTFIAMEYVEGTDLKEILRSDRPLPLAEVVGLVRQIADALDYAHSRGVVHRDVKPANVIVTPDGRIKITDFGIARLDTSNLTQDGQMLGTPNYMAPEQVQGLEVDHRADVFSLGVIVYELLTRHKPFQGENLTVVTHRIVHEQFVPVERHVEGLPAGITAVLARALEKDPERRYPRAGELAADLAAAVAAGAAGGDARPAGEARPATAPPAGAEAANDTRAVLPSQVAAANGSEKPTSTPTPAALQLRPAPPSGTSTASPPAAPPEPFARPAEPAARRRRGSPGRLAKVAGLAVAAGLAAAGLALGGLRWWTSSAPVESPAGDPAAARRTVELVELLRSGQRSLRAGDPGSALAAFRRAEALAPERPRIRDLREIAERQAEAFALVDAQGQHTASRLAEADLALAAGHAHDALEIADEVLAAEPDNRRARAIATAAQGTLDRQRRRVEAARLASAAPPAEPTAAAEPPPPSGRPAGSPGELASLVIEFVADRPEGTLLISANGQRIVKESFSFYDRVGLFKKRPYRGTITVPARAVEPGAVDFKIWVAVTGEPARLTEISGNFPPGVARRLDIRLNTDGGVTAGLE